METSDVFYYAKDFPSEFVYSLPGVEQTRTAESQIRSHDKFGQHHCCRQFSQVLVVQGQLSVVPNERIILRHREDAVHW